MDLNQTTLIWVLLWINAGLALLGLYWMSRLRRRFAAAFGNLDSKQDLGQTITEYFKKLGTSAKTLGNLERSYQKLADIGARSIQKVGIVRFNPFRDTGGDQSFVLALLDNNDTGLVMTSIHGREGTRVYVKPIDYGASKYTLSAEETAAIRAAKKTKPSKQTSGGQNGS